MSDQLKAKTAIKTLKRIMYNRKIARYIDINTNDLNHILSVLIDHYSAELDYLDARTELSEMEDE